MPDPSPLSRYRFMTADDVAERLRVSRDWVYKAAKTGRLPSIRLGGPDGPLRFVEEDLVAHIDAAREAWRPGKSSKSALSDAKTGPRYS